MWTEFWSTTLMQFTLQIVIKLRNMGGVGGDMRMVSNSYESLALSQLGARGPHSVTARPLSWAYNTVNTKARHWIRSRATYTLSYCTPPHAAQSVQRRRLRVAQPRNQGLIPGRGKIFWDVTPCGTVEIHTFFRNLCTPYSQSKSKPSK
jgi:hypothetical protein